MIVNHQPLSGAHGWSGEIGHICVEPEGAICSCGARGCLETVAGLKALGHAAGLGDNASTREILQHAGHSSRAQDAMTHAGHALGQALSAVVNTEIAPYLLPSLREELATRVLQAPWHTPQIDILPHSEDLSLRGGAHRVLDLIVDDPIHWKDQAITLL